MLDVDYFVFHSPYNKVLMFPTLGDVIKCCGASQIKTLRFLTNIFFLKLLLQLVQKSFARLFFNDFLRDARFCVSLWFACIYPISCRTYWNAF